MLSIKKGLMLPSGPYKTAGEMNWHHHETRYKNPVTGYSLAWQLCPQNAAH